MPHITESLWLAQLLRRDAIKASEVKVGDVIVGQGRVILVTQIERCEYGPKCYLTFERTPTRDGYEKSISLPIDGEVEIIPRENLKSGLSNA